MNFRMRCASSLGLLVLLLAGVAGAQTATPKLSLPPEEIAEVYGQKIHYFEAGQGEAVILLHGLGGSANSWIANIGPLSAKYHVYALDQVGFGRSDKPLLNYTMDTFADFLFGFMEQQKIAKAMVVGNSMGGWVAAKFALQHPDFVSKLVLVDPSGPAIEKASTSAARTTDQAVQSAGPNPASLAEERAWLERLFYNKQLVTDERVRAVFTAHVMHNDGYTIERVSAAYHRPDQYIGEQVASLKIPTLIVWGHEDALYPVAMAEAYHAAIPHSKLVIIDECGHVPQMEKPVQFNAAVLTFLGQP